MSARLEAQEDSVFHRVPGLSLEVEKATLAVTSFRWERDGYWIEGRPQEDLQTRETMWIVAASFRTCGEIVRTGIDEALKMAEGMYLELMVTLESSEGAGL